MRLRFTVSVLVTLLAVVAAGAATAQERFGGIAGIVTDSSQAPVPGATITATNKQTGAQKVAVTGTDGTYRISDLDPGRYTVTVELQGFQKVQADDVLVLLGKTADFPASLKVGGVTEVVTVTSDTKTQVDIHSTTVAHNVTAEELDRMPKTRSFQGIALTSPGVNQGDIEGGFQVNGASGAENSFTVDGVNTNSLIYGSSRQDTVFEYLQEVQVKTGGIQAEYGGALGGVISAVTKSGGNKFTGEGHYYFSGNTISASPVQRLQLSPIDDTTVLNVQDEKAGQQPQRDWRIDRRPDHAGQTVLLRIGVTAVHRSNEQLPVLEWNRAWIDSAVADGDAVVWQGHLFQSPDDGQRQHPLHAGPFDRHAVGLRWHGAQLHQQLALR